MQLRVDCSPVVVHQFQVEMPRQRIGPKFDFYQGIHKLTSATAPEWTAGRFVDGQWDDDVGQGSETGE